MADKGTVPDGRPHTLPGKEVKSRRLGVSIVNWRAADLTIDCLSSIAAELASVPDCGVFVVDNASGDGSAEKIQQAILVNGWEGWVSLIRAPSNAGFAAGNNLAIREMFKGSEVPEFVLLLNPDTVVRPGALRILLDFMSAHAEVGIGGGRSEDFDATPQDCCFGFPNILSEFAQYLRLRVVGRLIGSFRTQVPIPETPRRIGWVSGAFMMVRKSVFDDIGLMDESYFLYFEETDFTLRARNAGWTCWHIPQSRIVHFVGQSSGVTVRDGPLQRRPAYWFESRRRYFILNHGLLYAVLTDLLVIVACGVWQARRVLQRRRDRETPYFLRDFIAHSALVRLRRGLALRRIAW